MNRAVAALALLASLLGLTLAAVPASAATASRAASVLAVAETRAGDWYVYGAAGPSAFDCSGLVMWAERQEGISLPHSTYAMLASGLLVPTWHPAAGDLAFYGTGHVELVARGHDVTFGALNTGTRVGMHPWNGYWHPTMYFEVR